jgi:VanZ family protein
MKNFLRYNWPSILWAAFILYLCLLPGHDLPSVHIWEADKIGHMGVYTVLSLLTVWGWRKQTVMESLKTRTILKVLVLLGAYGFLVEILQEALTADRHFDMLDALANVIGACMGSGVSLLVFRPKS